MVEKGYKLVRYIDSDNIEWKLESNFTKGKRRDRIKLGKNLAFYVKGEPRYSTEDLEKLLQSFVKTLKIQNNMEHIVEVHITWFIEYLNNLQKNPELVEKILEEK